MLKVLIVDDERLIRKAIREYVENEGWEADEASDGVEAVGLAETECFDIVIMDARMPRLDGYAASREIRRKSKVPILMMSTCTGAYDTRRALEAECQGFVGKPFSVKELILQIKELVGKHRGMNCAC